jgi:hypothetical protein
MLKIVYRGEYILSETNDQLKILNLDNKLFGWVSSKGNGELFLYPHKNIPQSSILAMGKYRLYEVNEDKKFTDQPHLELSVGLGNWQAYLVPEGLPKKESMSRIVPTSEVITKTNTCSECKCGC